MGEITRRAFLKLTGCGGATAIAAGLGAKEARRLIPYVIPPTEFYRPQEWKLYATTCRECPAGCGIHMRHVDGRIVKAEGNPKHDVSHGGLCARGQSSLQGHYDPDRLQHPMQRDPSAKTFSKMAWGDALAAVANALAGAAGKVTLVSDLQTSALAEVMRQFMAGMNSPDRLLFHEVVNYEAMREAHEALLGVAAIPRYRLDKAEFILSLSADFLETWISPVEFAHDFARRHAYQGGRIGRFVYAGPRRSMTAHNADEYIQTAPGNETWVALAILREMLDQGLVKKDAARVAKLADSMGAADAAKRTGLPPERIAELARAFASADGSVALAGPGVGGGDGARRLAAAAALLNHAAGRIGTTVDFSQPHALSAADTHARFHDLADDLKGDDILVVHNVNVAFTCPELVEQFRKAGTIVYLGTLMDETAEMADFVLPIDSPLETWGMYQPYAGVHCLIQPTMARLYDTCPAGDILLSLAARSSAVRRFSNAPSEPEDRLTAGLRTPEGDFESHLRAAWNDLGKRVAPGVPSGKFWRDCLRQGGYFEQQQGAVATALVATSSTSQGDAWRQTPSPRHLQTAPAAAGANEVDLWLWPSLLTFDGRTANRGWIQEAPDPTTTIVWDNWVEIHPTLAARLGIAEGDVLELLAVRGKAAASAVITENIHPDTVAIATGQGHTAAGLTTAAGHGSNAFELMPLPSDSGMFGKVRIRKTGERRPCIAVAVTQDQHERELLQWVRLSHLRMMKPGDGDRLRLPLPSAMPPGNPNIGFNPKTDLYKNHYTKHRWAMVIDLERCIGCGACAVACYAENNVPVIGPQQCAKHRHMAWLRVQPYRHPQQHDRAAWMVLPCQQCDNAPCEPVCPVFAAVHNEEGVNAQVYNRCIGTRYCSHNCPYKVRRFNWLDHEVKKPLDWQLNPEVTVRCRGVMEKCNFCIQRIKHVELKARKEGDRPIKDGEIMPACAQSCPTRAILFGNLMNKESEVCKLTGVWEHSGDPRRYHLLGELSTKPAITYLKRIDANE